MKATKRFGLFITILFLAASGCESLFQKDGDVNIRIQNASSFNMDSLFVIFADDEVLYGDIGSGETTSYKTVSRSYRYAYIETKVDNHTAVLQPIDFVGESTLKTGNYTYLLDLINSGDTGYSLTLALRKD
ncbi:MAG: hypothetical protein CL666_03030 [Balneola sp.]|nr:hypothetical protein [Balneola sp.]|tara:strand:+ start:28709 stop:29101 length:393 start_codon:yes stop_codon:yes gene_type:complete